MPGMIAVEPPAAPHFIRIREIVRRKILPCGCGCLNYPMIVAVRAVRVVEVTFHQVVGVVAVRNGFVSAIGPVFVGHLVRPAIVFRGARSRVFRAYRDCVFVKMVTVRAVKVPVMKVVLVAVVLHGSVSTVRTMHVRVRFVNLMIAHFSSP
jgi:hypothetical protein